jgi:nucleoside-diphosphate-sugar epimerase
MRVALTGGSGYVGTAVRRALRARGDAVVALSRHTPAAPEPGEEWVSGELADGDALTRLVRDADAVVHAAAWVHRETADAATKEACFAVNVRGTQRLLETLARRGGALPFVFVGTTAVYGEAFVKCTEQSPCVPASTYGESKLAAERAVLAASAAGRIQAVILRPAMVYGVDAPGNIARLAGLVGRGVAPLVAGGRNRKSVVHADDLAAVILRAIDRAGQVSGRVFNVADTTSPMMREVGEALAMGLGKSLQWIPVPGALWSAGISLAHLWSNGGRRPDFGRTMAVYTSTTSVRATAVVNDLGVSFRDSILGLRESVSTH